MSLILHELQCSKSGYIFPPTSEALDDPNGLLAFGGNLSAATLITAYKRGIFPWYSEGDPILWWSPNPRTVFTPGDIHVSRKLGSQIRKADFAITLDHAFEQVINHCSEPRKQSADTWLIPEMRDAYINLHHQGFAHSIEIWQRGKLVAGLYGMALGKVFFGESMFSHVSNMSKIALYSLSEQLRLWGYALIDAQVASPHLFTMGAREIPRPEFEEILLNSIPEPPLPDKWLYSDSLPSSNIHLPG